MKGVSKCDSIKKWKRKMFKDCDETIDDPVMLDNKRLYVSASIRDLGIKTATYDGIIFIRPCVDDLDLHAPFYKGKCRILVKGVPGVFFIKGLAMYDNSGKYVPEGYDIAIYPTIDSNGKCSMIVPRQYINFSCSQKNNPFDIPIYEQFTCEDGTQSPLNFGYQGKDSWVAWERRSKLNNIDFDKFHKKQEIFND